MVLRVWALNLFIFLLKNGSVSLVCSVLLPFVCFCAFFFCNVLVSQTACNYTCTVLSHVIERTVIEIGNQNFKLKSFGDQIAFRKR